MIAKANSSEIDSNTTNDPLKFSKLNILPEANSNLSNTGIFLIPRVLSPDGI